MARCTSCCSARLGRLDCRSTGLGTFPTRGGPWLLPEWARRHQPPAFLQLHRGLFAAHFVLGEDLEDPAVIDRHASESGVDLAALHSALADDSAVAAVREAEMIGRKNGVYGTPAWLVAKRLITGLLPAVEFERLAEGAGHGQAVSPLASRREIDDPQF